MRNASKNVRNQVFQKHQAGKERILFGDSLGQVLHFKLLIVFPFILNIYERKKVNVYVLKSVNNFT